MEYKAKNQENLVSQRNMLSKTIMLSTKTIPSKLLGLKIRRAISTNTIIAVSYTHLIAEGVGEVIERYISVIEVQLGSPEMGMILTETIGEGFLLGRNHQFIQAGYTNHPLLTLFIEAGLKQEAALYVH